MTESCTTCPTYQGRFEPRNKCRACWSTYFNSNRGVTALLEVLFRKNDRKVAIETFGAKAAKIYSELRMEITSDPISTDNA
jgi:hypothetical protein